MNSDFAKRSPVTVAERPYPFPSRTRKSSSPAPKILRGQLLGKIGRRRALWHLGTFLAVGYSRHVERTPLSPCPWLLEAAGTIETRRPTQPSRCGADPAQPELRAAERLDRCLVGGPCQVREFRERMLGPLAESMAPRQPVGSPAALSSAATPRQPTRWRLVFGVILVAGLVVFASGPLLSGLTGMVSPAPSEAASPELSPPPSAASPTPTPSAQPSIAPSPTPTPSASSSGATYTVKSGDTLSIIGTKTSRNWKEIAKLNGIEAPYKIRVGQVLLLP